MNLLSLLFIISIATATTTLSTPDDDLPHNCNWSTEVSDMVLCDGIPQYLIASKWVFVTFLMIISIINLQRSLWC